MATPTEIDMREGKFSELFVLDPADDPQVITVPKGEFTVIHLGKQDDGTTPSVVGDDVIVGSNEDDALVFDYSVSPNKVPLFPQATFQSIGLDVPKGDTEERKLQMKAVGTNKVLMLITKGWFFYRAR